MKPSELVAVTKIRQWARDGRTKAIREAAGITCAELGDSIGVTDASISRWESGQRVPTGDPALKYAEAMFELEQFLNGDNGACDDCGEEDQLAEWGEDHFGSTSNSVTDAKWDGSASRFTDEQYRMSTAVCEGDGPPKSACSLPHHEPDGTINSNGVAAAAGRVNGSSLSDGAKSRAKAHLRSHYKTNLDKDPPEVIAAAATPAEPYAHEAFNGTHSHPHSPYGSQGGDSTHEHSHTHSNDSTHKHSHPAGIERAAQWAAEVRARPWTRTPNPTEAEFYSRMRASARGLVAAACPAVPTWSVRQEPDGWHVLTAAGTAWGEGPQASYADALEVITQALSDGGQALLADTWRSDMAFEGVSTGDGRYIKPGATEFRNPPSPYMLQTETAPGHMGADLAGFVTAAGMVGTTASGTGPFLANDAGRQQVQILAAVGRYGVSIDVAEAEGDPVCEEHGENLDECDFDCNWELHFSKIVVMGLCYDEETEILSEQGWVHFRDLPKGVRVATRSKAGEFEWQEPLRYTNDHWSGPMIRFTGGDIHRTLDLLVTPNHRMLVEEVATGRQRFIPAAALMKMSNSTFRIPKVASWGAADVRTFRIEREPVPAGDCACGCGQQVRPRTETLPPCRIPECDGAGYSDGLCNPHYQRRYRHGDPTAGGPMQPKRPNRKIDYAPKALPGHGHGPNMAPLELDGDLFAAVMGAWLAEGSVCNGEVLISQQPDSKGYPRYCQTFTADDGWWHDGRKFRWKNARLAEYLGQFGHAKDKFVPAALKNFSARQLWIFWDHYMAGDGSADGRKAYTSSPRLADDLQEIAQKLGMWAVVREHTSRGNLLDGRMIAPTGPGYVVAIRNRPGSRSAKAVWDWKAEQVERHEGMVRCVTVPNESLYVRRNGIPVWCGNTGTPFPAFADAYIELATNTAPVSASGAPLVEDTGDEVDDPFDSPALTAAANGTRPRPPAEYFAMPPMRVGDPRLVRQQSGAWACPLTVEPPDPETGLRRFYGHVADRLTCHTGIVDRCQLVPMNSPTGYAVFNKRPMLTAEGDTVRVGPITMGVGHADTNPRVKLTVDQIQAHYDGGPGAVRMGWAHAGSDQYGPWIAGVIGPGRTDEQIEEFSMLSVSGDWREVYRGKPIELVACLAGVFSPGFPLAAAALVAAGMTAPTTAQAIPETHAEFADDGRCIALVAAGVVRQPFPWERQLAALTRDQEALRDTIVALEQTTAPLRPYAAAEMQAQALGFAAPTPADRAVSAALQRIAAALKVAVAAQATDDDGDADPDDVKVGHGLQMMGTMLAQVITDQARDAAEDAAE